MSAEGLVTARAPGTVAITAAVEDRSASVTLVVAAVPVASLTISPDTAEILVGGSRQLAATLKDAAGNTLTDRTIVWSSSDSTIATVNGSKVVTGLAVGTVRITATAEGRSATATITVLPPPGTIALVNFDRAGNPLVRFDTQGNAIDAHGGEIRRFGESYYLYGEHYSCGFEWKNAQSPFCGFRVYSSQNLVDWVDRGPLFDPSTAYWQTRCSPGPMAADYGCFRPHVAYNPNTRKYVLWINGYGVPINFQVFESDSPVGPFVERGRPDLAYNNNPGWGVNFGDENLFVDEDGSGYLAYTDWTTGGDIVIEKLDSTFLSTSGKYVKLGLRGVEAPSMFKRGSRYYITLSDPNCGYCTTGTSYITAPSPLGPWSARRKLTTTSCGGQPGHVSQLPASGGGTWYLYQSDLWISRQANQAPAPQFWAPLSFDASGEIEPITCKSWYYVPALVGQAPSPNPEYYRLRCDIGEAGRVQRELRFTAGSDRLRAVSFNTFQRGRPSEPLVVELREDAPGGRVLQRSEVEPGRIAWTARKLTLPLELAVKSGEKYALRLRSASAQGCYGIAYRDDLPSRPAESLVSTDGGSTWTAEPARSVKLEISFQGTAAMPSRSALPKKGYPSRASTGSTAPLRGR